MAGKEELFEALSKVGFADRYFALVSKYPDIHTSPKLDTQGVLAASGRGFKHLRSENIYRLIERDADWVFELVISERTGMVEAVFQASAPDGARMGGPFPKMAREAYQRKEPNFEPTPRSPKPDVDSEEALNRVVQELLSLFDDLRHTLLAAGRR